jgi:glycosyltransferase involved in cell wall biosynthesis
MNGRLFDIKRIGFVSTRVAGTDGVSLEIRKWADVLEDLGIECYYITGESDRPREHTVLIPEAHFSHPDILDITQQSFGPERRDRKLSQAILDLSFTLSRKLSQAFKQFDLQWIVAENSLTIPMNLPLGMALVGQIEESEIGCLAHHHDFYWERDRFRINCVRDFIRYAFPPPLPQIQHVVINSVAGGEFSRRTGLSCRIIPNVMDFGTPPDQRVDFSRDFRQTLKIAEDDIMILQPTRVVPRKGIETTIELARRLDPEKAKVVISHASGDEGDEYADRLREFAALLGVELIFASGLVGGSAHYETKQNRKAFTIHDAYRAADLVAYPSDYEGFGNAFLEAIYYKRPVICNRYLIYRTDIEPCGFRTIVFDGYLTDDTMRRVRQVLEDEDAQKAMAEHNYRIASRFFGYSTLREEFEMLYRRPQNIYRLVGSGIGNSGILAP